MHLKWLEYQNILKIGVSDIIFLCVRIEKKNFDNNYLRRIIDRAAVLDEDVESAFKFGYTESNFKVPSGCHWNERRISKT